MFGEEVTAIHGDAQVEKIERLFSARLTTIPLCQTESLKEITLADGRRIVVEKLAVPNDLLVPFGGEAFVALIWGCVELFDAKQRHEIARTLIESGCRYVVCGGIDCEAWHDDADMAWAALSVELGSDQQMPAVMTSWHTNESEEDFVFFAFNLTNFDEHDFRKYLVLMIGHDHSQQNRIERLLAAVSR